MSLTNDPRERKLLAQFERLIIDANRLCDRNLGGTYEDDCRRSIEAARAAIEEFKRGQRRHD